MAKKQTKTERLRSNVKRTIREAEKRGYRFSDEVKQKVATGKYQTLAALQRGKYKALYDKASYLTEGGAIISGTRARNVYIPQKAAEKAARTRQRRKKVSEAAVAAAPAPAIPEISVRVINEGELIFSNITQMISEFPTPGAKGLQSYLSEQISKYGKNALLKAMANAPQQIVEHAQTLVMYNSNKVIHARAYRNFVHLMSGSFANISEQKAIGAMQDQL